MCEREKSLGWDANMTEIARMDELKQELEELRALVNTLLTIIMEEADGVQSGSAQPITSLPSLGSVSYTHRTLPTILLV